jgi:peptide chain release factor 2
MAMSQPDFWQDKILAEEKIKDFGEIKDLLDRFSLVEEGVKKVEKNLDEDFFYEVRRKFREIELEELFKGKYDKQAAVLSIYPGAGGEDAGDWAKMIFEMYRQYAEKRKWQVQVLDDSFNRRTLEIKGGYAYGYLKREVGVHRLVRVSPFSAKQLRHTSFALVEVLPDLPEVDESKIQIPESDLKFEFFRSSGPGGQNVNKVETAVRVTHLPTGIVVASQVERSQISNREKALKVLKAKLVDLMEKNHIAEVKDLRTSVKPEWGNQIRSYVLNPYKMVKDHRTEVETSDVQKVLDGDLDLFIEAEIEALR